MIRVHKDFDDPPEVLLRAGCKKKIKRAVDDKNGKKYSGHHYKHPQVLKRLKEDIYHHKCSYCESKIEHAAALQVEHYRPKDGLKTESPGDKNHHGYYWLGCEWSNLLLACPKCNGRGAKGTRFPISGARVFHDTPFDDAGAVKSFDRTRLKADSRALRREKPLLLNPEIDTPEDHLTFDHLGEIKGATKRGRTTIDICKLNRDLLYKERQKAVNELLEDINTLILVFMEGESGLNAGEFKTLLEKIFDKLTLRGQPDEEYALWGRFMFKEFEDCFVGRLRAAFRAPIRDAFRRYRENHPV